MGTTEVILQSSNIKATVMAGGQAGKGIQSSNFTKFQYARQRSWRVDKLARKCRAPLFPIPGRDYLLLLLYIVSIQYQYSISTVSTQYQYINSINIVSIY